MEIKTISSLIEDLSEKKSSQFIGITYTSTSGLIEPKTSKYVINTNVNLTRVYKEDLETLQKFRLTLTDSLEIVATDELILSLQTSLGKGIGNNPNFTRKDHVETINGTLRKVLHKDGTEGVEICGIVRSETVLIEGKYKVVNSAPKTIVKNKIKKLLNLGTSKIRTLTISLDKIASIRMNGEVIELCNEILITKVKGGVETTSSFSSVTV